MIDDEQVTPKPELPAGDVTEPKPADQRFRDLAELELQIRRRLRSNQRFLERFLDEDFVDEEESLDEEELSEDEEL
jgi:hypothetical protein